MDPELFEEWMMTGLVTVLILFMAFIVWDLAKKSKAGKFGTLILFFALGLGVLGFIIKGLVIGSLRRRGHVTPAPRASSNHL
ncbi:DUF2788 domain-containing protein [Pseudomonas aeruginosa]|nr:DUF2788 domain-containing protein [Pseudomonas aeruginosa]